MADVYFAASYGGIPMLVSSVQTERGRDIAIQSPALGNQHTLSDRGERLLAARMEILFCDQPGQAHYLDRYKAFKALFDGQPRILSHPLDGSYSAIASDMTVTSDAGEICVKVSCTFLRESPPQRVFPAEAGSSSVAGLEATATAAAAAKLSLSELAELLEDSPSTTAALAVPGEALAQVTAWSEADDLDSQEVFLGVATLTTQIDAAIATLELKSDLSRWPAYKAMILLRYTIVRAGQAFTADSRAMFDLYVETPRPLLTICAEIYGARRARELADRVARGNRLRTPGLVPAGTTLKMPALEAA